MTLALQLTDASHHKHRQSGTVSYQALARQYRPSSFAQVVGQEHVVTALSNALDTDRIHHAFLFTGTRGVGKTTLARIFAKALNCITNGVSATPCGECTACVGISEGRFIDLIEVDAASRTKVEDTRDLLDNVQYAPTNGRYKVYLIDEVHMLSNSSFNALLKTLEEPPPHVKFLLATTDPQKLPVTVLSRCLQFNLKALGLEQIADHLATITSHEGIDSEPSALRLLARSAQGSVRDSLSLLDQAIAYGNASVSEQGVRDMLGLIDDRFVIDLVSGLADSSMPALLETVELMAERSVDFHSAFDELLVMLHGIALEQQVPGASESRQADADTLRRLADRIAVDDVQLFYQSALLGKRDLALAPDGRIGFEMALLRMIAFQLPKGVPPATSTDDAKSSSAGPASNGQGAKRASPGASASATNRVADTNGSHGNARPAAVRPPATSTPVIVEATPESDVNRSAQGGVAARHNDSDEHAKRDEHNPAMDGSATQHTAHKAAPVNARVASSKSSDSEPDAPENADSREGSQNYSGSESISAHAAAIRLALNGGKATVHEARPTNNTQAGVRDKNATSGQRDYDSRARPDSPANKANGADPDSTTVRAGQTDEAAASDGEVNGRGSTVQQADPPARAPARPAGVTGAYFADKRHWLSFIEASELEGPIRECAMNMAPQSFRDDTLTLCLSQSHAWLLNNSREQRLQTMLNELVTEPIKLQVQQVDARIESPAEDIRTHRQQRQHDAERAILSDPNIAALRETFNAQMVEGSIKPASEKTEAS